MSNSQELCFLPATALRQMILRRKLSARELTEACLAQIDRVNPKVNAIVTLVPDQAMALAHRADELLAHGKVLGALHGLPIAHKDLFWTQGIRTTMGSPIYADFYPEADALIVERSHRAGAIPIGKTNVPEFGAGSQTFNPIFGPTRNPYDLSKTCGGSSGGAAVALACGMVPLADGSDMGGSLRNPAAFCNVVGLRPSPGRVPVWPRQLAWSPLSVGGPMGRTVADVALFLSALAGPDERDPLSIAESGERFTRSLETCLSGVKLAWSQDLGGLPVDPRVQKVFQAQRQVFLDLGCRVIDADPDLSEADEVFKVWRAWQFEATRGELLDRYRDRLKDTVIWNIEQGRQLTGPELGKAARLRTLLYDRMRDFFGTYDFVITPTTQVPPFSVDQAYVTHIGDTPMETYIDWMKSCYYISVLAAPAISVPAGFTEDGLPVGIQIVGRYRDELGVLRLAYAFEQETQWWRTHPKIATTPQEDTSNG